MQQEPDRPARPGDVFLFLHIESTAGTTMGALLHRVVPGRVVTMPIGDTMTAEEAHASFGPDVMGGARLVIGHYDHSVVARVPGLRTMSVLRDPVDRLVSTYRRYRRSTDMGSEFWHEEITRDDLSLVEFARHRYAPYALTQTQTRQLAGAMWGDVDPRTPTAELLSMATLNLEGLAFLGLLERLDESLLALERLFGLPRITDVEHRNAAPEDRPQLTAATRDELEELCAVDRELYRRATAEFDRRL